MGRLPEQLRFGKLSLRQKILAAMLVGCGTVLVVTITTAVVFVVFCTRVDDAAHRGWHPLPVLSGVVAVTLIAVGVAMVVAWRLQERVAEPIINLARSAGAVETAAAGMVPRVVQESDDEVGQLVQAFNGMMDRVAERDTLLREAQASLERQGADLAQQSTERQETERALQGRETRLRMLLDRAPALVWTTDWELRFSSSMGSLLAPLELKPDELAGRSLADVFQTTDHNCPAIAAHRRALAGERITFEQDWGGRHSHSQVEPLLDASQQVIGVIGVAVDMTDAHRAEEHRRLLFDAVPDVIFTLDADGRLTSLNPAFERSTGWSRAEWLGKPYGPLLHPDDQVRAAAVLRAALEGQAPALYQVRCRTRAGEYRDAELNLTPVVEGGRVTGVLGVARDVTRERHLAKQLALRELAEPPRPAYNETRQS